MPRYIDADALLEALSKKKCETGKQRYTEGFNDAIMRVRSMISSAATADVAEVVRCQDCEYFGIGKDHIPCCYNICGLPKPLRIDYCSYGVRK